MVIIEEIKYTGAYPLAAKIPKSAGPKPKAAQTAQTITANADG